MGVEGWNDDQKPYERSPEHEKARVAGCHGAWQGITTRSLACF